MKKKTDEKMLKQPYYEGGAEAMKLMVQKHLRYPERMLGSGIEGTVSIRYDIDHHGEVVGSKIISGIGPAFEEEAGRVVRLFKFVVPKTPRKLKVIFHKTIHIHFKVPTTEVTQKPLDNPPIPAAIQYNYVTPSSPVKEQPSGEQKTYQYQITITKS